VEDCQYLNLFLLGVDEVDNAVAPVNQLPQSFVLDLWHHPSHAGKLFQAPDLLDGLVLKKSPKSRKPSGRSSQESPRDPTKPVL